MMDWNNGYHWQWGMTAGLFMLLIWILIIIGVILLVRWLVTGPERNNGGSPRMSGAQSLLDERLARGEISVSEYRERSAALREQESR